MLKVRLLFMADQPRLPFVRSFRVFQLQEHFTLLPLNFMRPVDRILVMAAVRVHRLSAGALRGARIVVSRSQRP